jgi:flagellar biosynthesis protein FlhG
MKDDDQRATRMPMEDHAHVRFDQPHAQVARSAALRRLTVMEPGRWHAPLGGRPGARFISVHGRRGVGKSTVAANLAIALAELRSRVVLIDLDLGCPTQHRMFGVATPVPGLGALLDSQIDTMEQALTPTAVRNLYLVSAEGAGPRARSTNAEQQHHLLQQIWELDADVVIADVGTRPGDELVDLFALGALRVVVAAPDARSIRRAYNLFKAEIVREIDHVAGGTPEGARLVAALSEQPPRMMSELLESLGARPQVRAALEQALAAFGGRLIGNRARNSEEADLMHASSRLIADYLGVAVPVLGIVEASDQIGAAGVSGRPLLLGTGIDQNVRLFHSMAEQLLMDAADAEAPRCVSRPAAIVDRTGGAPPRRAPARGDPDRKVAAGSGGDGDGNGESAGEDDEEDGAPLPVPLGAYMRRHPRHPVDWYALYVSVAGRETPVRVFEVSQVGASIESLPGFDVGETGRLIFSQIAGQPAVSVTVVDARRPLHRAGLRFEEAAGEDVGARLAAWAAALVSTRWLPPAPR